MKRIRTPVLLANVISPFEVVPSAKIAQLGLSPAAAFAPKAACIPVKVPNSLVAPNNLPVKVTKFKNPIKTAAIPRILPKIPKICPKVEFFFDFLLAIKPSFL